MKTVGPYVDFLRFKFDHFFNGDDIGAGGAPQGPVNLSADKAREYVGARKAGSFTLLDVRQDWEYEELRIPGATHIPLPELSERVGELDKTKPVLTYCKAGGRSSAAANILSGQGFSPVYSLDGGILAWTGAAAVGPKSSGLSLLGDHASVKEILLAAYGMELMLGQYYADMAGKMADEETAKTFRKLAGFEEKHKNRVFALYKRHGDPAAGREDLEKHVSPGTLEGGLTGDEYLENVGGDPEAAAEVLELAMGIEAQALDLYARFAEKSEVAESRAILLELAEEEKRHLKALGALMNKLGQNPRDLM